MSSVMADEYPSFQNFDLKGRAEPLTCPPARCVGPFLGCKDSGFYAATA
jgi:hypothetical protein